MGFLSFPSAKKERPGKSTAIIVTEIPFYHFEKWSAGQHDQRGSDYKDLKQRIADRLVEELVYKYYPKARGQLSKIEIGTALSAQYYLGSSIGESYGLCCDMRRYFDFELNNLLKPRQECPGLWLSGQDLMCPGMVVGVRL